MEIKLEMNDWIINNELFITEGSQGYEVRTLTENDDDSKFLFGSKDFEKCLVWVWNCF